jgi:tRNA pseudouridine55 synthase
VSATGILVANKPRGMTSHDVVNGARRLFSTRAVGHAGTLDPMASGVLVLLFGEATKLAGYLTLADKEYDATVTFGRATDTLDAEGRTIAEQALAGDWLDADRLSNALESERARTKQDPPEFSAISVGGERAYRRARRGDSVSLESRDVRVDRLELVERDELSLRFRLVVSKGYYVRAFARDLGIALDVPAHLSALVRLGSGPFRIGAAATWPPDVRPELIPLASAARLCLPSATLAQSGEERAGWGQRLTPDDFAKESPPAGTAAWFAADGRLVALGAQQPDGTFRVLRGFHDES